MPLNSGEKTFLDEIAAGACGVAYNGIRPLPPVLVRFTLPGRQVETHFRPSAAGFYEMRLNPLPLRTPKPGAEQTARFVEIADTYGFAQAVILSFAALADELERVVPVTFRQRSNPLGYLGRLETPAPALAECAHSPARHEEHLRTRLLDATPVPASSILPTPLDLYLELARQHDVQATHEAIGAMHRLDLLFAPGHDPGELLVRLPAPRSLTANGYKGAF